MITLNPGALGVGLEEDTAIVVMGNTELEVIGSGIVTVVDGHPMSYTNLPDIDVGEPLTMCDLKVHFLSKGARYHLHKRLQSYV
jgi:cyanophycinase